MIVITMRRYMETALPDVPVYLEEPEDPPAYYLILRQTGSDEVNRILEATVAVQSYAPSLYGAIVLNDRVKRAALAMAPADGVFSVHLNTDYEYTNTQTKQYRYQAVFEVYY